MLSVAAIGSSGAASSYYTKDNYYTADAAQETSLWAGDGAEKAGLAGEVGIEEFKAILDGKMPDGTELGTGNGKQRPGFDLTFSAPKTLSMLAYIGGDERLLEANMKATKATIAWVEKNLAETRMKGPNGKIEAVKTGNLVVALFQHDTNRNQDPQAHIHAVIANATQGPDGKWRALWNGKIWQAYALNAHMAQGLTADRGIAVFDSREQNLTNEKLFLVNITRVRDSLELIVDSGPRVERGIVRNAGEKTSALETTGEVTIDRHGRAPGRQGPIASTPPASPPQQSGPQGPRPPGISPDRTPDPSTKGRPVFPEREAPPEQYNVPLPERQRDWGL